MSDAADPISPLPVAHTNLTTHQVYGGVNTYAHGKIDTSAVPTNEISLTWKDALDIINPLQQLPVVGDVYRAVTGDKISGVARVAGGFLWGGIGGGFSAAAMAAYAEANGNQSPGEEIVTALLGPDEESTPPAETTMVAAAAPTDPAVPAAATAAAAIDNNADEAPLSLLAPSVTPPSPKALSNKTAAPPVPSQGAPAATPTTPGVTPAPNGLPFFSASIAPTQKTPSTGAATDQALTQQALDIAPLRDRLNHKNPTQVSSLAKPLPQFAARKLMPTIAPKATALAAQSQNLQLLQGVAPATPAANAPATTMATTAPPLPGNSTEAPAGTTAQMIAPNSAGAGAGTTATSTLAATTNYGQHNPLPAALVQDLMQQALDKYQAMHALNPATGFGLQ